MPIIETVEELAEFLEQNDEWRRRLFAILVPRALQRMPDELEEFREETRAEFKAVRQEMREGFERVDREMREGFERVDREFENVRQEMREGFERVEQELAKRDEQIKKNTNDIAELKGLSLETKYRDQARSYFSQLLKNVRVIHFPDIEDRLAPEPPLSEQERNDLIETDLFVAGIDKISGEEVVIAVEISWTVDLTDIERAARRAQLMAARSVPAIGVAAGRELAAGAREAAQQLGCGIMLGGRLEVSPASLGAN
ncbi:MAG: hypothetical protein N2554_07380 [Fimbriimonadales bacterium]|nr:hypothetical protein [Fimbriimonadales bacterium]